MIIKLSVNNTIEGEFSIRELKILSNSIFETIKEIEDWEFQTRVGAYVGEARLLLERFFKLNESLNKQENEKIKMGFSKDEMLIVNNSLNEILHGFHIEDFENRIGAKTSEVRLLLTMIAQDLDEIEGIPDGKRKNYFGYLR